MTSLYHEAGRLISSGPAEDSSQSVDSRPAGRHILDHVAREIQEFGSPSLDSAAAHDDHCCD